MVRLAAESGSVGTTQQSALDGVRPRAESVLAASPLHELRRLSIDSHNGALVISGVVSSYYHKQLAQEVIRAVCCGVEIVNSIRVDDSRS